MDENKNAITKFFDDLSNRIRPINLFDSEQADDFKKKLDQIDILYHSAQHTDATNNEILHQLAHLDIEITRYMETGYTENQEIVLTLEPEKLYTNSGNYKLRKYKYEKASVYVSDVYKNLSTSNLSIEQILTFKDTLDNAVNNTSSYTEKSEITFFYNEIIAKLVLAYQMIYFLDHNKLPDMNISELCDTNTYIRVFLDRLSNQMKKNQSNISTYTQITISNLLEGKNTQISQLLNSNIFDVLVLGESRVVDSSSGGKTNLTKQPKPSSNPLTTKKPKSNTNPQTTKLSTSNTLPSSKNSEVSAQLLAQYNCKTSLYQKFVNLFYKRFPNAETVTLIFKKEHIFGSVSFYTEVHRIDSNKFSLPIPDRKRRLLVGCIFSDNITHFNISENFEPFVPLEIRHPFFECINLEIVHLPDNLVVIPQSFLAHTNIRKMVIPSKTTKICQGAFANCTKLEQLLNFSESRVSEIQCGAFENCALTELEFPISIKEIYNHAFGKNKNLTSVSLPMCELGILTAFWKDYKNDPNNYYHDDCNPFTDCPNLSKLNFVDKHGILRTYTGEKGFYPTILPGSKDQTVTLTLSGYENVFGLPVERDVTFFVDASHFRIPHGREIAKFIKAVRFSDNIYSIVEDPHDETDGYINRYYEDDYYSHDLTNFSGLSNIQTIVLPKFLKNLGAGEKVQRIIDHNTNHNTIRTIIDGKSVDSEDFDSYVTDNGYSYLDIHDYGFFSRTGIRYLKLPPSLVSMEPGSFCECTNLESVTIAGDSTSSLTEIPPSCFSSCGNLSSFPFKHCPQVKKVGFSAFEATSLTSITFSGESVLCDVEILAFRCPKLVKLVAPARIANCNRMFTYNSQFEANLKQLIFFGLDNEDSDIFQKISESAR